MSYNGLTNQGLEYLTRCQVESKPVVFSKVKIGNGNIPMGSTGETTTDLYSFKKEIEILNKEQVENSIKMEILINNFDVLEEFYVKEIGVYVMDNDIEKLYWYINKDRPSPLPDKNTPAKHKYILHLETSQMESIILNYTGADLLVDKEFVEEKLNEVKDRTKALQFSDIESMKQKNLKVGDIVEVLGYYTAGDGAGHKRIIANEDDGSGVQLSNKLWANIVHNGEVNIKWLGAKGDGINDDTNAFNTQFNLFVPAGTFLINNTIKMQSGNSLRGENMYDSIIKIESDVDGIWVNTDCTLKNLGFNSDLETYNSDVIKIGDETFTKKAKLSTMCGVKVSNISSNFEMKSGTGILFHILFSLFKENGERQVMDGYWGLDINHIRYNGHFNRAFKVESKIHQQNQKTGWLTYSSVEEVKGYGAITAIEYLANYSVGTLDENQYTPSGTLSFKNCNFESCDKTEYGIIINGILSSLDNVVCGDYQYAKSGYSTYKVYFYKKLREHGEIICYSKFISYSSITDRFIQIENYNNSYEHFFRRYINLKVLPNIYLSDKIEKDIIFSINNLQIKNKKLIWLFSYSKKSFLASNHKSDELINFTCSLKVRTYNISEVENNTIGLCSFNYFYNQTESKMRAYLKNCGFIKHVDFVYTESEEEVKIGVVFSPKNNSLPIRNFFKLESKTLELITLQPKEVDITDDEYEQLKKVEVLFDGVIFNDTITQPENIPFITGGNLIISPVNHTISTVYNGQVYTLTLNNQVQSLNTPYHVEKMKAEGVYNDFIAYMDEKTLYDKEQRNLEKQKQLAYQEALKENPNLSYEEFMSVQPMTLNLVEEPQPSEALKKFMKKYL